MPWNRKHSRRFVFNWLANGILAENRYVGRYFRPISGQKINRNIAELHGRGFMTSSFPDYPLIIALRHLRQSREVAPIQSCAPLRTSKSLLEWSMFRSMTEHPKAAVP